MASMVAILLLPSLLVRAASLAFDVILQVAHKLKLATCKLEIWSGIYNRQACRSNGLASDQQPPTRGGDEALCSTTTCAAHVRA